MTRRFFYTEPLAAAWMAKHFGMRFWNEKHEIHVLPLVDAEGSYYNLIHPDSLCLLEPQDGDVLYHNAETRIDRFAAIVGSVWLYDVPRAKRGVNNGLRIIQRNGIPFMWPESEDA